MASVVHAFARLLTIEAQDPLLTFLPPWLAVAAVAATIAAAAIATKAAVSTEASSAATAATRAIFAWFGFVDFEGASAKFLAIELINGRRGFFLGGHLDEAKAS